MSSSASVSVSDDDATHMTRSGGASRTFRSIFSSTAQPDGNDELDLGDDSGSELKLHSFEHSASNRHSDADDDAGWSDDAASPLPPQKERERSGDDSNATQHTELDNNSLVSSEQLADGDAHFQHERSMDEWADDDDDEETWKDLLQAKVNELELAIQTNDDVESAALRDERRPTTQSQRSKIPRTAAGGSLVQSRAVSSPSNFLRKRANPRDPTPSLVSKLCSGHGSSSEAKRSSAKVPSSGASRRESLPRSASTSAIVRPGTARIPRKNSLDGSSVGTLRPPAAAAVAAASDLPPAAQRAISDAEAVRRFLLHDIKQMSMDRLVADAKRLQYLDERYRQHASVSDAESQLRAA